MDTFNASTILVVDDNPAHRYATGRFLRAAGYEVTEAATGQDALLRAQDQPALIVLDVNLPDIDGYEVCRALKRNQATARIPIIHLSATFVGTADYVHGLNAGADGYLTHPVEPAVLVATVRAFLRTRAAEERWRRSEHRFRDIFDHVISGIAVVDRDDRLIEVNPAMCRILGRSREQLMGASVRPLLMPEASVGTHGRHASGEHRLGSAGSATLTVGDDARVDIEWELVENELEQERILVAIDITARRQLETEREISLVSERAARAEAERANRLKDQFLATVSHELRSPLNAIVGWAHILQLKANVCPEEIRKGIDAIDRNAKLQSRLINDLLDISRARSGKLFIERQRVSLWSVIQCACSDAAAAASARDITLSLFGAGEETYVLGDALRLQQVVGNLLNNAIKFSAPHDTVAVALSRTDRHTAEVRVVDHGRGIAPEFLPHIFDTFRQEDAATNRSHEGMGLGLAIVKQLAEVHGGSVAAESPGLGLGASFVVELPVIVEEPRGPTTGAPLEPAPQVQPCGLAGLRVLYVDDDADARDLVQRLLQERRASVTLASSAAEAMVLLLRESPDLVISDIGMPKQDGYSFMQQVHATFGSSRPPPAIALTAFGQAEDRLRALASGYDAHLTKPIDPAELFLTIARVTSHRPEVVE